MYMKGSSVDNYKLETRQSEALIPNISDHRLTKSGSYGPEKFSQLGKSIKVRKLSTGHLVLDVDVDLIIDKMQHFLDQLEALNTKS